MSEIMSLLVFEGSRQQLLSTLMAKIDSAKAHREEHKARNEPEDEAEGRYIDNMLNAFEAADDHSKRLEYWSDLREMSRKGEILGGTKQGWGHVWQHVGTSGRESSAPSDGERQSGDDKGKQRAYMANDVNQAPDENIPEQLGEEDKDDEQIEAAKREAESRQLAEVGGLDGDDVKSPAKLTSFSDNEQDADSEHEGRHHEI
jgi:hypothetical protein